MSRGWIQKMNKDVPTEGVVKWLAKERDAAKEKLEQLIGYTKGLETRILEMEAAANIAREEYAESIAKERKKTAAAERALAEQESKKQKKRENNIRRLFEVLKELAAREGVEL